MALRNAPDWMFCPSPWLVGGRRGDKCKRADRETGSSEGNREVADDGGTGGWDLFQVGEVFNLPVIMVEPPALRLQAGIRIRKIMADGGDPTPVEQLERRDAPSGGGSLSTPCPAGVEGDKGSGRELAVGRLEVQQVVVTDQSGSLKPHYI